jgi:tetratricopeptide (TPR) repeat protein
MWRNVSLRILAAALAAAFLVSLPVYGRGGRGGGGGMRGGAGGGMPRPGGGAMARPGGGGMARPGGGGMSRPGGGGGYGGSPSFSSPRPGGGAYGGGARPGGGAYGGGARPGAGPGGGVNRPGVGQPGTGGGRPGAGGGGIDNRPSINNRPGGGNVVNNRPGGGNVVNNRPGGGNVVNNRPGGGNVVNNRPGGGNVINNRTGGGNTNIINRGNVNVGNNFGAGYGARPPAYNNWRGGYGAYHNGWMNGYWHGYHNGTGWNWGSFALGSALGVTAWGLGSSLYGWGYAPYANPYYYPTAVAQPIVIQQTLDGGAPQTVTVPASTYDYSQPLDTQSAPPAANVADPAVAKFDSGREAFKSGDYATALQCTDEALKTLPNDATLHEFRALVLFAVKQYEQAAPPLYAVLSVGPGWDWTTMAGLYPSIDVYTQQLRALEAYVTQNPKSVGSRFVLAYHYMTQGHNDEALAQLKGIVQLNPNDTLSAQLITQLSPPSDNSAPPPSTTTTAATPAAKAGKIEGTWKASPAKQTSINLNVRDDGTFTWKVDTNGKAQDIVGNWSLAGGILTLAQNDNGGALVGNVTWPSETQFNFRALGAPPSDPGLTFSQ